MSHTHTLLLWDRVFACPEAQLLRTIGKINHNVLFGVTETRRTGGLIKTTNVSLGESKVSQGLSKSCFFYVWPWLLQIITLFNYKQLQGVKYIHPLYAYVYR